ncbi:hypothetical protein HK101_004043, partial [Irineochytrium annulatum]
MQRFLSQQSQQNPRLRHLRSQQPDVIVSIADPSIQRYDSTKPAGRPRQREPEAPQSSAISPPWGVSADARPRHNPYGDSGHERDDRDRHSMPPPRPQQSYQPPYPFFPSPEYGQGPIYADYSHFGFPASNFPPRYGFPGGFSPFGFGGGPGPGQYSQPPPAQYPPAPYSQPPYPQDNHDRNQPHPSRRHREPPNEQNQQARNRQYADDLRQQIDDARDRKQQERRGGNPHDTHDNHAPWERKAGGMAGHPDDYDR